MAVPLKFGHRVGLLVALAAAALATVTVVALLLGARGEQQLAGIETRYVPLIELDRDLKAQFAELPHALEDAATAGEDSRLRDADRVYAVMVARLHAGRQPIIDNGGDPVALETELAGYYTAARAVAAAIVGGTPPGQLDVKIAQMRRAQEAVRGQLDAATTPDRRRLAAAFAAARASQRDAIWTDIIVGCGATVLIGLLSWRLIRETVRALHAVSVGVERLARGEFSHEIAVTARDELGDLARQANRTAQRLREYRERADRDAGELRATADELARASRYKSEFLANMSHELRTPLNSILVLSEILAEPQAASQATDPARGDGGDGNDDDDDDDGGDGDDGDAQRAKRVELATLIHRSGEELLALINEVLDLSKIEAGKQDLACEPYPLADLADYVRRMFQPIAMQKRLGFEVVTGDDLASEIRTDRARLAQIVKNLIANAFKFTEHGGVTVRISRGPLARPAGAVALAIPDAIVIAVADTGIGIAPDKQTWIFEAFAQADAGITRKFGGTGLGLTIARQLAMRLGGDLVVDSTLGVGSTFSVVLPVAGPSETDGTAPRVAPAVPASGASAAVAPPPVEDRRRRSTASPYLIGAVDAAEPEPALDGKTVMVVDGDVRHIYALASALTARRLRVVTAADGPEALDELARHPALHAILIDATAPGATGVEAIRQVRAQPRFGELPILALTEPGHDARERCLVAGATDCLARPIEVAHLIGALRARLA